MDNQQQNDNVWVSREEYSRLQALANTPQPVTVPEGTIASGPYVAAMEPVLTDQPPKTRTQYYVLLALAVGAFVYPPLMLIFLLMGAMVGAKALRKNTNPAPTKIATPGSTAKKVAITTAIGAIILVACPWLLFIPFLIMWQLGCMTGLNDCKTA